MNTGVWVKIGGRKRWERVYGRFLAGYVRWDRNKYAWEVEDLWCGVVHRGRETFAVSAKNKATRKANEVLQERSSKANHKPGDGQEE